MREVSFVGETVIDLGELEKRSDLHGQQLIGKCAYLAPNLYNQSNDGQIVIGCNDGTLIIFDDYHQQNTWKFNLPKVNRNTIKKRKEWRPGS